MRGLRYSHLVFAVALVSVWAFGPPLLGRGGGGSTTQASAPLDVRDEHAVKAAFLYNFAARHVKWPDAAHKDKTSPFVIGVLGKDAITPVLTETCRNRKSGDRPIEVRAVDDTAGIAACHILYVPAARESEIEAIATPIREKPVLLVADSEDSVKKAAHLGFYIEKSKVRFAAHPPSAKKAGLEISSELLKLARVIENRPGGSR